MEERDRWNLEIVMAETPQALLRAQRKLEELIELYGLASDAHAEAEAQYRAAVGEATKRLRDEKNPATLVLTLAKSECAPLKEAVMKAEGERKRVEKLTRAIELRINTFKFIGRGIDTHINNQPGNGA